MAKSNVYNGEVWITDWNSFTTSGSSNKEIAKYDITPERIIFSGMATICFWSDGSKTVSKCQEGDTYSQELGVLNCIAQKYTKQLNRTVRKLISNSKKHA